MPDFSFLPQKADVINWMSSFSARKNMLGSPHAFFAEASLKALSAH
ncbi:hypothetical protein LT85_3793 [Collimonas arenae]|uniref:Uncharacterized protein n=1 Tax=Collimonas arenae TaxID=279058 RepID=A0A0A1FEL5_9BURK|nr:hypothetical protein LT85_3793 [Collimonas arenae]